jgi:hypothetical protein
MFACDTSFCTWSSSYSLCAGERCPLFRHAAAEVENERNSSFRNKDRLEFSNLCDCETIYLMNLLVDMPTGNHRSTDFKPFYTGTGDIGFRCGKTGAGSEILQIPDSSIAFVVST